MAKKDATGRGGEADWRKKVRLLLMVIARARKIPFSPETIRDGGFLVGEGRTEKVKELPKGYGRERRN